MEHLFWLIYRKDTVRYQECIAFIPQNLSELTHWAHIWHFQNHFLEWKCKFWLRFHWSLFIPVQWTISQHWAIIWTNDCLVYWCIYMHHSASMINLQRKHFTLLLRPNVWRALERDKARSHVMPSPKIKSWRSPNKPLFCPFQIVLTKVLANVAKHFLRYR